MLLPSRACQFHVLPKYDELEEADLRQISDTATAPRKSIRRTRLRLSL